MGLSTPSGSLVGVAGPQGPHNGSYIGAGPRFLLARGRRPVGVPRVPPLRGGSSAPADAAPRLWPPSYLQATPLVPGENGPWVPTQGQEQFVNHSWGGPRVPRSTTFSFSASKGAHSHPVDSLALNDCSPPGEETPESRAASRKCARPRRPPARSRRGAATRRRCRRACVLGTARTSGLRAGLGLLEGEAAWGKGLRVS